MGITLQPWTIYIGLAIAGIFTGIGITIGTAITKLWLEPYIKTLRRNK